MANRMKEAGTQEDFERWNKGLPAKRKQKVAKPQPEAPKIKDVLLFKDIDLEEIKIMLDGRRKTQKNADGVMFIGFNVSYQKKDGSSVTGWMPEGDYIELKRILFIDGNVNIDVLE